MANYFYISRVDSLPAVGSRNPETMYVSKNSETDLADITFIGTDVNEVRRIITKTDVDGYITTALTAFSNVKIYVDIAARDADSISKNTLAYVEDASADASVPSGSAFYIYNNSLSTWIKIADEDLLVKKHSHDNMVTIDKLGEVNGNLAYDGTEIPNNVILVTSSW